MKMQAAQLKLHSSGPKHYFVGQMTKRRAQWHVKLPMGKLTSLRLRWGFARRKEARQSFLEMEDLHGPQSCSNKKMMAAVHCTNWRACFRCVKTKKQKNKLKTKER